MEKTLGFQLLIAVLIVGAIVTLIVLVIINRYNKSPIKTEINQIAKNSGAYINMSYQKIKKSAERKISQSYLTGGSWILASKKDSDVLYTFRTNGELLITTDGEVQKCSYELIVDNNSLLISRKGVTKHYMIVNVYNDYLFLKKLSNDKIMIFANHTKYKDELKSVIRQNAERLI